jgi:two-component system, cell cycle sensor histidine kinase and response regulator CckA
MWRDMSTRKVILVADDEVILRNLIRTLLDEEGYEVLAAADGSEALRLSRTHEGTIDLLLTDVEMPRLDGMSAYRRISAERADIKVLFMSGAIPESLEVLKGLPFLPKPFVISALCTKVREVLEMTSPAVVG